MALRSVAVLAAMLLITYACTKVEHVAKSWMGFDDDGNGVVLVVPKPYGLVLLVNLVGSSFVLVMLAMKVTVARKKYKVHYPAMYATGEDDGARMFNCVQRGHQQALETYPGFLVASLVAGLKFPLVVSLTGILWGYARLKWAEGYRTGVPDKRYQNKISFFIWFGYFIPLMLCGVVAVELLYPNDILV